MARLTTLTTLLSMVKNHIGQSATIGTAMNANLMQLISDKQKWLASEYDWPFLETRWTVTLSPTSRYVTFPTEDDLGNTVAINQERPVITEIFWCNAWQTVGVGIGSREYNIRNSDTNIPIRAQEVQDPVLRYRWATETTFEVWPVNATTQYFRFTAQRALTALTVGTDCADLDDELIVLFVAADLLMRSKQQDAQLKLQYAQERLARLRGSYPADSDIIVLGGLDYPTRRNISMIATAGGGTGGSVTPPTTTYTYYWGVAVTTTLDEAGVLALSSGTMGSLSIAKTISSSAQYIYFAYPASLGAASFIVNSFPSTAWVLTVVTVNSVSCNVYRSLNLLTGTNYVISLS